MKNLLSILTPVLRRTKEPSSWAAIAVVLGMVGIPAPIVAALGVIADPATVNAVATLGAAAAAFFMKEKGGS